MRADAVKRVLRSRADGTFVSCKVPHYLSSRGVKLRGITSRLETLHSNGSVSWSGGAERRAAWAGRGGGRRRGSAVDRQLTRIINGEGKPPARPFVLARRTLEALSMHAMRPVLSQAVVADERLRIGTAVDVVCIRGDALVLVEVKCGYANVRDAVHRRAGRPQRMGGPLSRAWDTNSNRHLAQLALTHHLFVSSAARAAALKAAGVERVEAALLYVDDAESALYELPAWWSKRGSALAKHVASC